VLRQALAQARALGHSYVGSEHLLLALCREPGQGGQLLREAGCTASALRKALEEREALGRPGMPVCGGMTANARLAVAQAAGAARRLGHRDVGTAHLLLALTSMPDSTAGTLLRERAGTEELFSQVSWSLRQQPVAATGKEAAATKLLDQYCVDLTAQADRLGPVLGRERELDLVLRILSRKTKNNPALVGEPGVGKTAIAEGLAIRLAAGRVPPVLAGRRLVRLDMATMVAGTKYRGEFEERIRDILDEVRRAGNIILFIDELHTIMGAGSAEGAIDAANILKPALGRGEIQIVGATTTAEFTRHVEKDAALCRRFRKVAVEEPTPEAALGILQGLRPGLEQHHGIRIGDDALQAAVDLSCRYLTGRSLPDKAVDLLDEGAARTRMEGVSPAERQGVELDRQLRAAVRESRFEQAAALRDRLDGLRRGSRRSGLPVLSAQQIARVVADQTGIPASRLRSDEAKALLDLEQILSRQVAGQPEAVRAVAAAVRRGRSGLADPCRPLASMLFTGPTGVGKTELCRALAEAVYGSRDAMIRMDMSEFMEQHTVSRLIGAPPGYVGCGDGGELTEKVRQRPYSLILLDEIEKAHRDVTALLLQILEDGVLTDSMGRSADFRHTMVVMTSNLGAAEAAGRSGGLGFAPAADTGDRVTARLREYFSPELLGRIDKVAVFHPLDRAALTQIAAHLLDETVRRAAAAGVTLTVAENAAPALATLAHRDAAGARALRRLVRSQVEEPLAELVLRGGCGPQQVIDDGAGALRLRSLQTS
jgi:ATP-dependent Clp protease ATP-binding subunit ClpC